MQIRPAPSLTRLVGRTRELADVERLVAAHRLVTLTGVGGTGKTRLAAELAQRHEHIAWVELVPCKDPMRVAQQTAEVLSIRETADRGTMAALLDALRERELLLILDNCEHLIGACATLAETLLSHCPKLRILITSREPLAIAGEQVWPVPPLAVATEAVELFVERAAAATPSFALDETNTQAVLEICRRVDGIPLAIELAAARVRVLTPQQIAARLADGFAILSTGARNAVPHHRTLRATIDWSYALLTPREQTLLARLSVFAGTFSLEAVEAICTDPPPPVPRRSSEFLGSSGDVVHAEELRGTPRNPRNQPIDAVDILDLLGSLVDKSLVVSRSGAGVVRYSLLETIRQYAAEQLGDAPALQRRHATAFAKIVDDALPELLVAAPSMFDRLAPDHDNIRTALAWALEHEPDAIALPLAATFRWYWYYLILWAEGLRWMHRVLERASPARTPDRAAVISGVGALTFYLGDAAAGRRYLEEAEAMWRELGDERQLAFTLSALAQLLGASGDVDAAERHASESVMLARRAGHPCDVAYCLTNAGSYVAQLRGDLAEADRQLEEATAIWHARDHRLCLPFVLNARALLAMRRRDHAAAAQFARAALVETREHRDVWFASRSLRIIAWSGGPSVRAARLVGAADRMLRDISARVLLHEKDEHECFLAALRGALAPDALEAALAEGAAMSFDEACALALDDVRLHVRDLGPVRITLGGEPLVVEGSSSGRARELLLYLLAHPEGCTREEVGVAFWPDATSEQVKNSFHVTLHRLRKLLGTPDAITSDNGRYRVSLPHVVDSQRFEREMQLALRDPARRETALQLYEGDYLEGEAVGTWSEAIRARLRDLYLRARG